MSLPANNEKIFLQSKFCRKKKCYKVNFAENKYFYKVNSAEIFFFYGRLKDGNFFIWTHHVYGDACLLYRQGRAWPGVGRGWRGAGGVVVGQPALGTRTTRCVSSCALSAAREPGSKNIESSVLVSSSILRGSAYEYPRV